MPPRELRPIIERVYWSAVSGLNDAPEELTEECLANERKVGSTGSKSNQGSGASGKVLSELLGILADQEIRARLEQLVKKLSAIRKCPPREPVQQRMRSRRPGWVQTAVIQILTEHIVPMQVKDIHAAVEALIGESVSKSSVNGALSGDLRGSSPKLVRVALGWYQLRPTTS